MSELKNEKIEKSIDAMAKELFDNTGVDQNEIKKILVVLGADKLAENVVELGRPDRLEQLNLGNLRLAARVSGSTICI